MLLSLLTPDDEAIIQAFQHTLDQKMKKQVQFNGVIFHKCLTPKSVTIRSYMQQK
jgi:hypothetical protein